MRGSILVAPVKAAWLGVFFLTLAWSAINPRDYPTWVLEVAPALIGLVIMAFTYNSFRLTPLLYGLILAHCIVLMVGGHYTYAEVPLFDYLKPVFGWERNNYDKLGHFMQGFMPAILAREILIRRAVVASGENRFGSGEGAVTARLPLMVRPSAPRFLNFGDRFTLPVVLQNQTATPLSVDVAFRADNLKVTGPNALRVSVPANDRVAARFPAAAMSAGTTPAAWSIRSALPTV